MKTKSLCLLLLACFTMATAQTDIPAGRTANASLFGIRSDGQTLNTRSIQKALDVLHAQGGGTLMFYVGRYLTGTIHLRSGINIRLQPGAVLVGSGSPFDYDFVNGEAALIVGDSVEHVTIDGKGLIDGQADLLNAAIDEQVRQGHIAAFRPKLLHLNSCKDVTTNTVQWLNAANEAPVRSPGRALPRYDRSPKAGDYDISSFGAVADGTTNNTRAIQAAIDFAAGKGGGRVVLAAGRYVSGSLHLRTGVTLHVERGAELLGSLNPLDYDRELSTALLLARKQEHIGLTGGGTVDCRGRQVAYNLVDLIHRGVISDPLKLDRPNEGIRPMVIYFRECDHIDVCDITLRNSASWVETYDQCRYLRIDGITVHSNAYWNNDGLDVVDCEHVTVCNSFFDASDDAICLKSHDANARCADILIRNNVARSGANGIKFGTVSRGAFEDIRIINNKVYDTFRSAITLAAVDGATITRVVVDSLTAVRTGNIIYLRIGERWSGGKQGAMHDVTISNVYAEVPADKPDRGYEYEGPIEDLPRNVSPAAIVGLADNRITDITLRNITMVYPGGGTPFYAERKATPDGMASVPEMRASYPEFSQFKELPAWGLYIRHAGNIRMENITFKAAKPDYRPCIVLDDVAGIRLTDVDFDEPASVNKKQIYSNNVNNLNIQSKK